MTVGQEYPCGGAAGPATDESRLGGFDITTLTQSVAGLQAEEQRAGDDLQALQAQYPDGIPLEATRQHRLRNQLWYRVRAHEKVHWFHSVSTSTGLARTFSENDLTRNLFQVLRTAPGDTQIWLPLLRWARGAGPACPDELRSYIGTFRFADVVHGAIDGDPSALDHGLVAVRAFFARAEEPLSSDPHFRLGRPFIAEGAAKAAEWIYLLALDPSGSTQAELDFANSPEVYRRTLSFVRQVIPAVPLAGQLLALGLVADVALHPRYPAGLWPDIWQAEPQDSADLAPGPRFVVVAQLLAKLPADAYRDKQALGSLLIALVQDVLGWPHPDEVTRAMLVEIDQVLAAPANAELLKILDGDLHPIRKVRTALEVRLQDTFAFVAPINAGLINARQTLPSGYRGSVFEPLGAIDRILTPGAWGRERLANQLVYAQCPECPVHADQTYITELTEDEACRELVAGRCTSARGRSAVRNEFQRCQLVDRTLRDCLGPDWRSRLRFFFGVEDTTATRTS